MTDIGVVYASLALSAKGVSGQVSKELGGAGASGGTVASKGFGKSFGGALGGITKVAAGAVGIVGGLLGGIALKGGISRALNIENAQAKLTGLGHSTKSVEGIMKNAMASVKGTAFGLGDAATVAAGAVAAGIKPGAELERTLKLTGDAATIAGVGMGEMGAIFNKVAASNKIQGDVINQLNDAGIPIVQLLGKELGTTAEETLKLASQGKIGFETFQKAMDAGLGGAAQASGKTFTGALANVKAALSRVGETVATPALGLLKDVFNGLIPVFDSVNAALKPLVAGFSETFGPKISAGISSFLGGLSGLSAGIGQKLKPVGDVIGQVASALKPLFDGFNALNGAALGAAAGGLGGLLSKLPFVGKLFTGLTGPIGLVVGAIAGMVAGSKPLQEALGGAFTSILGTLGGLLRQLAPLFGQIGGAATGLLSTLGDSLAPVVAMLADVFAQLAPVIGTLVATVLPPLAAVIGAVVSAILPLIPIVLDLVSSLIPPLIQIFDAVIPVLGLVIAAIAPLVALLGSILVPVIRALMPVVTTVFQAVADIITAVMTVVQGVINVVLGIISGNWSQVWTGIKQIFSGIWDTIKAVLGAGVAIVKSVITASLTIIQTLWSTAWNAVKSVISTVWEGIKTGVRNGIDGVMGFVGGIKGKVLGALSGAGTWLLDAGKNIIHGLLAGIGSMVGSIANAILALVPGPIVGVFKKALGIHSPSRVFEQLGIFTGEGYIKGIDGMHSKIGHSVQAMVNVPTAPTYAGSTGLNGSGTTSGPQVTQHIYPSDGMSEKQLAGKAAKELMWAI